MENLELAPGPWSYETTAAPGTPDGNGHVYIVDATGRRIASLWGPARVKMATAQLMITARDASKNV
jgi:hypothetical protein